MRATAQHVDTRGKTAATAGNAPPERELLERACPRLYETGGLRRAPVRGYKNVLKRVVGGEFAIVLPTVKELALI
jgi:hypothetical protein